MELVCFILIIYFCGAVLAIQIAESVLSYKIKRVLGLHLPNKNIKNCSNPKIWYKVFNHKIGFYLTLPITSLIMLGAFIHQFISDLINCPICTSYWIGVLLGLFIGFTAPQSLVLAFVPVGMVMVLKSLKQY